MIRHYSVPLALLSLLIFCSQTARAQDSDEQDLYFSPKLDVAMILAMNTMWIDGREGSDELVPKLRESHEYIPFIPVVFFDPGSPNIPQRYQTFYSTRETDTYTDSSAVGALDDLDELGRGKQMQILNVIGYRLSMNPSARVALEPGYSTEPGENAEVASERGVTVRDYLASIWRIAPERIEILPPRRLCDSSDNAFAQQEAQRVIVRTDSWEIARPICFVRMEAEPSMLNIAATITPNVAPARVASVEMIVSAGDRILTRHMFTGSPDSTFYRVEGILPAIWTIETMPDHVSAQAVVMTTEGRARSTKVVSIPVRVKSRMRGDVCEYESEDHLALPFFPYRDTTLNPMHRLWLDAFADRILARYGDEVRGMRVVVSPARDITEARGIPEDVLMSFSSPMEIIRNDLIAPLIDPRREIPMFVRTYEHEEGSDDMHDFDELEMFRAWLGEDAVTKVQEFRDSEMREDGFYGTFEMLDDSLGNASLWNARGRAVREYLESRLGTTSPEVGGRPHGEDSYDEDSYADHSDGNMVIAMPEDRFFSRMVEVWIQFPMPELEMPTDYDRTLPPAESVEPEYSEDGEVHPEEYEMEEYEESTED